MDLVNKVYTPYTKPGDKLCYVDTRSNHLPAVFKAVPKGVAKRIATNSSSRKVFEAAKGPFIKALRAAHYAEGDLKEAWDYANYVDPPKVNPSTNEVEEAGPSAPFNDPEEAGSNAPPTPTTWRRPAPTPPQGRRRGRRRAEISPLS